MGVLPFYRKCAKLGKPDFVFSISCFNDQHCLTFAKLQPPISASVRLRLSGAGFRGNSPYPDSVRSHILHCFSSAMLRFRNDLTISGRVCWSKTNDSGFESSNNSMFDLVASRQPLHLNFIVATSLQQISSFFAESCDPTKNAHFYQLLLMSAQIFTCCSEPSNAKRFPRFVR